MFQQILDENLVRSGPICESAIYSIENGECRAASSDTLPKEIEFYHAFQRGGDLSNLSFGIDFNDAMYQPLKIDRSSTIGRNGETGIVVVRSMESLVVGIYREGVQASRAVKAVEQAANLLKGRGQ
ncbi:Profilin-1A-like protein [Cladobotryum mycophilum]|uniref:Profilin n=1 Tax=Cladobotryum mycophilum TaxID=491253 RepID=A0ABR0SJ06_9HYPO